MYQQMTVLGNVGSEPEMRYTTGGTPVTSFSVAVNRKWTAADGERKEQTTWFRVSAWDKQAEPCANYLKKGSKVLVVGEIQQPNIWSDKDGNNRASLEIRASTVKFLGSRADDAAPAQSNGSTPTASVRDDDIPF